MNPTFKYAIPGYYFFYSRLKTKPEKISWFFILPLPILLFALIQGYSGREIFILPTFQFVIFYLLYEIGYMYNDCFTVTKEKNPHFWVPEPETKVIREYYIAVVLIRLSSVLIVSAFILKLYFYEEQNRANLLLVILFANNCFFWLHNYFRSRYNILIYFGLAYSKYLFFLLPFNCYKMEIDFLIGTLLIFPIIRTIEYSSKEKFSIELFDGIRKKRHLARVIYYFNATCISIFIFWPEKKWILMLCYFLSYRIATLITDWNFRNSSNLRNLKS